MVSSSTSWFRGLTWSSSFTPEDPIILRDEILNIMVAGRDTVELNVPLLEAFSVVDVNLKDCCANHLRRVYAL
jgi:hypothetical protein